MSSSAPIQSPLNCTTAGKVAWLPRGRVCILDYNVAPCIPVCPCSHSARLTLGTLSVKELLTSSLGDLGLNRCGVLGILHLCLCFGAKCLLVVPDSALSSVAPLTVLTKVLWFMHEKPSLLFSLLVLALGELWMTVAGPLRWAP